MPFFIPFRMLLPLGLENIMVVGKSHSSQHDALATNRMQADLNNEGYAAGYIGAISAKNRTSVSRVDIRMVQSHLQKIGNITADEYANKCVGGPGDPNISQIQAAARGLDSTSNASNKNRIATLMRIPIRSIPILIESFKQNPSYAKAKLLCLLGDRTPEIIDYLASWIKNTPLGTGCWVYDGGNKYCQLVEVDNAIWSLGRAGDKKAIPVLVNKLNGCGTLNTDYSHIRALAMALKSIGEKNPEAPELVSAAIALQNFLNKSGISGHVVRANSRPQKSFVQDMRESLTEVFLAAALYKCGDRNDMGKNILTAYLDDWRGIFVKFAGYILYGEKKLVTAPPLFTDRTGLSGSQQKSVAGNAL
jgi:hypothetical protein